MITWLDKIDGLDLGDPQKNVTAADMNQIKNQHNALETNVPVQITAASNILLGGAPANLNTLGTLAQAINNDPNAYATLVTLIAAKLSKVLTENTNITGDFNLSLGTLANHLNALSVYTETQLFLHAQTDLTVNVHAAVGTDVVGISVTPNQVAIAAGFANSTTLYLRDENSSTAFEINAVDGGITLDANANNVVITGANIALNGNITSLVDSETPSGTMNSSNPTFTLANTPVVGTVKVYWNGQRLKAGVGYTISGATLTMTTPPDNGDTLECDYRK